VETVEQHRARRGPGKRAFCSTLAILAALVVACTPSAPGPGAAGESFRKEVLATKESLAASLADAVARRESRSVRIILEQTCHVAQSQGQPFTCGITVLDRNGITLASATPGEPLRRLNYSRYEVVMDALKERRIVKTKLYLQDRRTLYVVAIPLERQGEVLGLLTLTYEAADLMNRYGLTEQDLRVDLNG
jgi:hypothetical protein